VGAVRSAPSSAETIFQLTNGDRTPRGIAPLIASSTLTHYAEAQSLAMAARGDTFHSSLPDGIVAENVGAIPTVANWEQRLNSAFMGSPDHRFNILYGQLKTIGVAVIVSGGIAYVTEEFGLGIEEPARATPRPTCTPIVRTDCRYRLVPSP
jgi:uncharacterized protein YkwD